MREVKSSVTMSDTPGPGSGSRILSLGDPVGRSSSVNHDHEEKQDGEDMGFGRFVLWIGGKNILHEVYMLGLAMLVVVFSVLFGVLLYVGKVQLDRIIGGEKFSDASHSMFIDVLSTLNVTNRETYCEAHATAFSGHDLIVANIFVSFLYGIYCTFVNAKLRRKTGFNILAVFLLVDVTMWTVALLTFSTHWNRLRWYHTFVVSFLSAALPPFIMVSIKKRKLRAKMLCVSLIMGISVTVYGWSSAVYVALWIKGVVSTTLSRILVVGIAFPMLTCCLQNAIKTFVGNMIFKRRGSLFVFIITGMEILLLAPGSFVFYLIPERQVFLITAALNIFGNAFSSVYFAKYIHQYAKASKSALVVAPESFISNASTVTSPKKSSKYLTGTIALTKNEVRKQYVILLQNSKVIGQLISHISSGAFVYLFRRQFNVMDTAKNVDDLSVVGQLGILVLLNVIAGTITGIILSIMMGINLFAMRVEKSVVYLAFCVSTTSLALSLIFLGVVLPCHHIY